MNTRNFRLDPPPKKKNETCFIFCFFLFGTFPFIERKCIGHTPFKLVIFSELSQQYCKLSKKEPLHVCQNPREQTVSCQNNFASAAIGSGKMLNLFQQITPLPTSVSCFPGHQGEKDIMRLRQLVGLLEEIEECAYRKGISAGLAT